MLFLKIALNRICIFAQQNVEFAFMIPIKYTQFSLTLHGMGEFQQKFEFLTRLKLESFSLVTSYQYSIGYLFLKFFFIFE